MYVPLCICLLIIILANCSVGPLVNAWCMRMEAKNSYFKRIAQIRNFKNLSFSIAKRHQRLICGYLQGKFFTYDELQSGPCMCSQGCYLSFIPFIPSIFSNDGTKLSNDILCNDIIEEIQILTLKQFYPGAEKLPPFLDLYLEVIPLLKTYQISL